MKRSQINASIIEAGEKFKQHGWILPPNPKWDVTDFGLGDFDNCGLVLVNLTEQAEYCEKIMYARKNQQTPQHYHKVKKEDIICRYGSMAIQLFSNKSSIRLQVNGEENDIPTDKPFIMNSGDRITLTKAVDHSFWPESDYAVIGEVSTANDDTNDNFFANPDIGRFSDIEEDEKAIIKLVSE